MKKIIIALLVMTACMSFMVPAPVHDDKAKKNLEACRAINAAICGRQLDELHKYIAADVVDHSADAMKDVVGLDSLKAMLGMMWSGMTDMKMIAIKEIADEEYVFQWMTVKATITVAQPGMPAGPLEMNSLQVNKMKDYKVIEHWEFMQPRDMMNMMNSQPPEPIVKPKPKPKSSVKSKSKPRRK